MKPALQILCMISFITVATPSLAQNAPQQSRQYDIEIIVFTRNLKGTGRTEHWPHLAEPPGWSQAVVPGERNTPETPITRLPASDHRLRKEYRNLAATGGRLRPILHQAWRQPVLKKDESIPVYLRSRNRGQRVSDRAGKTFPELEGTVRVSGKRYLHVHLDLLLRRPAPPNLRSDTQTGNAYANTYAHRYQAYRMTDHRRMRSERLHYIDHPLMGVLILATPYEGREPAATTSPISDVSPAPEQAETSALQPVDESVSESGTANTDPKGAQP